MADNIIIPTEEKDSKTPKATRKAWVGAAWGEVIGSFVTGVALVPLIIARALKNRSSTPSNADKITVSVLAALGTLTGIVTGYYTGKRRGEKIDTQEKEAGQTVVEKPRFWNWKVAQGYLAGIATSAGIGILTSLAFKNSGGAPKATKWLGRTAVAGGMIGGGILGKTQMQEEYSRASEIQKSQEQNSPVPETNKPQSVLSPQTKGQTFIQQEDDRRKVAESTQQHLS